ncbi:flagellar basal body-associated FliL family protein [Porticoccaceae bacterium]|nr:flagellar basal body-associated FliL family protein [Porticoccaceae bacterium]MDA8788649.1 flagellar basal body-associated FliL family protein [Porticoccaceae bacterium]MDB2634378.1 flagellar basal body-associated FliL family protein [Porticoccaceae bacterium]
MSEKKMSILTWIFVVVMMACTAGGFFAIGAFDKGISAEELISQIESTQEAESEIIDGTSNDSAQRSIARDPELYNDIYYILEEPLLANVNGSQKYIQAKVALLIEDTEKSVITSHLSEHNFAIRNALLEVLSAQPEDQMMDPHWRVNLRAELRQAGNSVIEPRTGHSEIKDVFFSQFVVQ